MSFPDNPLDASMSRSHFESITHADRESYASPRDSFSSDRTLVDTPRPRRSATSYTSNIPSIQRSTSTSTTATENSTDLAASSRGKRKKVKMFLKRLGNGMLESLAYSGGAGVDFVPTGSMDKRSNEQVMGDVYGVQLLIW